MRKKIKTKQKKNDDVSFLPTELSRRYFQESSRTVHFSIALLIVVLYDKITDGLKSRRSYLTVF